MAVEEDEEEEKKYSEIFLLSRPDGRGGEA
jgi:hypothetical protein